eukprot:XP_014787917.1 PREDICTED: uncharacterized protein LOC106881911 [Octopus bimaculoides]
MEKRCISSDSNQSERDRLLFRKLVQWVSACIIFTLLVILVGLSWSYISTLASLQTRVEQLEKQCTDYEKRVEEYVEVKIKETFIKIKKEDIIYEPLRFRRQTVCDCPPD